MLNRNCEVKLTALEPEHQDLPDETFEQFRRATQHVADHGWSDNPTNIVDSKLKLHDTTYEDMQEKIDPRSKSRASCTVAGC